ncbi:O-antigen ligase family protein [Erythrobacter colymbi]|uniref:O-antigen ligase family protein n=1 Tax=Erythrobacter colymbi TaxID=1161202 RepID=UPI000A3AA489|nr:O-antigen ligase family protein [Erythrobacter colymbi]
MDQTATDRISAWPFVLLLLVAFAAGGGGIGYPMANLAVQLAALAALASRPGSVAAFWREAPLALRLLVILSLALPLCQIIPLPESVWTTLPGRSLVARSLEQVGASGAMPISVDPRRTLLALTALVTPAAMLFAGWNLPRERLIDLGWLVVGLGIVTVLMGLVQLGATTGAGTLYGARKAGALLLGTFANRNSTGLFLTFAVGLAALLPAPRPHPAIVYARVAVCVLLAVGVALTQSRTALVLLIVPVLLGTARALSVLLARKTPGAARAAMIGLGALALVGVAGGTLVVAGPGRIGEALERFEAKDDPRRFIWEDATFSAGRYWPVGAGIGTFDEIYQIDESLENLTARRAGRAHNDFIELTMEAGAAGLAVAAAWLVMLAWLTLRARRDPHRWAAWAGGAFLLVIALQSITDYPLRNQTILAFAGFALLLLVRLAGSDRRART